MRLLLAVFVLLGGAGISIAGQKDLFELSSGESHYSGIEIPNESRDFPIMDDIGFKLSIVSFEGEIPRIMYWTSDWCVPTCMSDFPNLIRLRDKFEPQVPIQLNYVSRTKSPSVQDILGQLEKMQSRNSVADGYNHDELIEAIMGSPKNGVEINIVSPRALTRLARGENEVLKPMARGEAPITVFLDKNRTIVAQRKGWVKWDENAEYTELFEAYIK